MKCGLKKYSELFPAYWRCEQPENRGWESLKFPVIRVLGVMWSFGFEVKSFEGANQLPIEDQVESNYAHALHNLFELNQGQPAGRQGSKSAFIQLHRPRLLKAQVAKIYSTREYLEDASDSLDPGYSLLALNLGKRYEFSFNHGQFINDSDTSPLILSPFANPPHPLGAHFEGFKIKKDQYLPAMQLVHGWIRLKPANGYIEKIRRQLGLDAPSGMNSDDSGWVYLLPDGFCVAGEMKLPWQSSPISGWFKATYRRHGSHKEVERVLRPWFDPILGEQKKIDALREPWNKAILQLTEGMRQLETETNVGPEWLSLEVNEQLAPEDLFWKSESGDYLFRRQQPKADDVFIDNQGISAKMANRSGGESPLSSLLIEPDSFQIKGGRSQITIQTVDPDDEEEDSGGKIHDRVNAIYAFDDSNEHLSLSNRKGNTLKLAVPLIQTSEDLRIATGLPQPSPTDEVDLIWTFTPLRGGWLHWPLPSATLGGLNRLIKSEAIVNNPLDRLIKSEAIANNPLTQALPGALSFGNRRGLPGFSKQVREWSLSLTDIERAKLEITLNLTGAWRIQKATVTLENGSVSFDGLLPITPFRQTPWRLLPDHAERALGSQALSAVSPDRLRGIERRIWLQAKDEDAESAVRVFASIQGVRLDANRPPSVALEGKLSLTTQIKVDKKKTNKELEKALRPWVWLRHEHLPTVQTLPLALAGDQRNVPSGSRELAPFRRVPLVKDKQFELTYKFDHALDMSRGSVSLSSTEDQYLRATHGEPWRDEIGLAVTTLPSVIFYPGLIRKSDVSRLDFERNRWSGLNTPVQYEVRHDIALRDEYYAHATLPPEESELEEGANDNDTKPRSIIVGDGLFAPRHDNGPERGSTGNTVWRAAWRKNNRLVALAATDDRSLVVKDDSGLRLDGVFGESPIKVTAIKIRDAIKWVEPGDEHQSFGDYPDPTRIEWIGSLEISTTPKIKLHGLPSESDLVGLKGKFTRDVGGSNYPVDVAFGTADIKRHGKSFIDQRGLSVYLDTAVKLDPNCGSYTLKKVVNQVDGAEYQLLTLGGHISTDEDKGLSFWCADVPVREGATVDLRTLLSKDVENSHSFARNHLAGFRWSLNYNDELPSSAKGLVPIEGLYFEPLELVSVGLSQGSHDDSAPQKITISGRLRLAVSPNSDDEIPQSQGEAKLVLERMSQETQFYATIIEADITWPLANPQTAKSSVPRLSFRWPNPVKTKPNGTLTIEIGGLSHDVDLHVKRDQEGDITAERNNDITVNKDGHVDSLPRDWITPQKIAVHITRAQNLMLRPTQVTLDYLGQFSKRKKDWNLVLYLQANLLNGRFQLGDKSRFEITKQCHSSVGKIADSGGRKDRDSAFQFDGRFLALSWTAEESNHPLLDGFSVIGGTGSLAAIVEARTGGAIGPKFHIQNAVLEGEFQLRPLALRKEPPPLIRDLRLVIDDSEKGHDYRLHGSLELVNWFNWPRITLEDIPGMSGWQTGKLTDQDDAGVINHLAKVEFRGQSISVSDLAGPKGVTCAVEVHHTLLMGQECTITWSIYQIVSMRSFREFRAELVNQRPRRDHKLAKGPVSTLALTDINRLGGRDLQASRLLFHPDAARHAAITGDLAEAVIQETEQDTKRNFMMLEFSSHHFLGQISDESPKMFVVPLPAVSFLGPPDSEKRPFSSGEAERLFSSRPEKGKKVTLWQPKSDGFDPKRGGFSVPPVALRVASENQLQEAASRAREKGCDVATELLFESQSDSGVTHRAVFQSYALSDKGDRAGSLELAALSLPGAPTAMFLSGYTKCVEQDGNVRPDAYGFAQTGSIEARGTDDDRKSSGYLKALSRAREWILRNLVASPSRLRVDEAAQVRETFLIRIVAPSRGGDRLVELARQYKDTLSNLSDWPDETLSRLAPWATAGLMNIDVPVGKLIIPAEVVWSSALMSRRPRSPAIMTKVKPDQGQYLTVKTVAKPEIALLPGYLPLSVAPELFASEDVFVPEGDTDGPRLTATGVRSVWTLNDGQAPILADVNSKDSAQKKQQSFWLSDRFRVAFRPFSPHIPEVSSKAAKNGEPPPMTFAMPPQYRAAIPRALLPAPPGPVPPHDPADNVEKGATSQRQFFAPGLAEISRVSPRAGVCASTRLGLTQSDSKACIRASETPLHARMPRPPLLAANDRPRASSHESGHLSVSDNPHVIVHGPRRARPGTDLTPTGLSREPRSEWAVSLRLAYPSQGLLSSDWEGTFEFEEVGLYGDLPVDGDGERLTVWSIDHVVLKMGGAEYSPQSKPEAGADLGVSGVAGAKFGGFKHDDGSTDDATKRTALNDLQLLPPASPAFLELTLKQNKTQKHDETSLIRIVRFELLAAGKEQHLLESPVYFRFDDPEYNDRLDGIAKLDRRTLTDKENSNFDLVFAADRSDVRDSDRIELGIGLRAVTPGAKLNTFFRNIDADLALDNEKVALVIERLRTGQQDSDYLVDGPAAKEEDKRLFRWLPAPKDEAGEPITFTSHYIDCGKLTKDRDGIVNPKEQPALAVGDQLVLSLYRGGLPDNDDEMKKPLAKLSFDVVSRPLLPANTSAFALLELVSVIKLDKNRKREIERVSVPLYASGSAATLVELVDPRDLIDGVVRRRAIYQWRGFAPIPNLETPETGPRYALQKINSVGGSWLPAGLDQDWLPFVTKTNLDEDGNENTSLEIDAMQAGSGFSPVDADNPNIR